MLINCSGKEIHKEKKKLKRDKWSNGMLFFTTNRQMLNLDPRLHPFNFPLHFFCWLWCQMLRIFLGSVEVRCPHCFLCQRLSFPQCLPPFSLLGEREAEKAFALLSNNENFPLVSSLFSTNPEHRPILASMRKIYSIPNRKTRHTSISKFCFCLDLSSRIHSCLFYWYHLKFCQISSRFKFSNNLTKCRAWCISPFLVTLWEVIFFSC